ncbi:MAG: transposase [Hormoscilla sp. GUM202]|nr:transposase [Hormoscilla sp. GUM202]MBO1351790.1 transposase [Hormoscilla sp. GUM202]
MTFDGGTNGNVFLGFVKEMLVPQLWEGACVVADNLPAHYAKGVKEAIESVGAKLVYLSAYSPDFNPIENWWSQLKSLLKKIKPQTREEIEAAISKGIDMITAEHLQHWFTHCCYFS